MMFVYYLSRIAEETLERTSAMIGVPKARYYCPVCERAVWRWLRFRRLVGVKKRRLEPERRQCPHCRSFERMRQIRLLFDQQKITRKKPRFLHVAPERLLRRYLRGELGERYLSIDLYMKEVDRREDLTQMTLADNSFDYIYCSNVLEHVQDDRAAMSELYRVLAPDGLAIIQVPIKGQATYENASITSPEERAEHFGQADHVRFYGTDIKTRLEAAGFEVEESWMPDVLELPPEQLERMNITRRERIHLCRKPKERGQ